MRIRRTDTIAGYPALRVRALLRSGDWFSLEQVQAAFKLPTKEDAWSALRTLQQTGLLSEEASPSDDPWWRITAEGMRLRQASAAKPLLRRTADALVDRLLDRVQRLNHDSGYSRCVSEVVVFGSYLTPVDRLGDVDIALRIARKETDSRQQNQRDNEMTAKARAGGRRFKSFFDELAWPEQAVTVALKQRSRGLSIHYMESVAFSGAFRLLYIEPEWVDQFLPQPTPFKSPLVIDLHFSSGELARVAERLLAGAREGDPWQILRTHLNHGGYDALVVSPEGARAAPL